MTKSLFPFIARSIACLIFPLSAAAADKPNIVVIMADDLGWMDLHCYGNEKVDTPHLDQLAREGMRFTDGYAASPVCSPTRAAMMTGQSPARLRLTNHAPGNKDGFAPEGSDLKEAAMVRNLALNKVTIAEHLKSAGYATAHIGKWHLSYVSRREDRAGEKEAALRPEHQGFDVNVGGCFRGGPPSYFSPYRIPALADGEEGEYLPERLADEAIKFIHEHKDEPFFLNWWPYSVHYPMEAEEELVKKYKARGGMKDPVFAAMTEAMDRGIGRFLKALDEEGLAEKTLVIFTSDNGSYNGSNRPLRGFKGMIFEGGIRVPWIVRWPGVVEPGSVNSTPIISMDCHATILDVAGIELEEASVRDGVSLVPLLKQSGSFERDALYFHYPNYAFHKRNRLASAIRSGNYKLIKRYDDDSLELYDLANDIGEKQNLARNRPKVARDLKEKLEAWLEESGAVFPTRGGNR